MNVLVICDGIDWSATRVMENVLRHSKFDLTIKQWDLPEDLSPYDLVYYRYGPLARFHKDRINNSVKFVYGFSGMGALKKSFNLGTRRLADWLYKFDGYTVNNSWLGKKIHSIDPDLPLHFCPSGVDTLLFKPSKPPSEFCIGWAGRASGGRKGFQKFLDLPFKQKTAAVGKGTGRKFTDMPDFYKNISVYVSVTVEEGSPLPPKEAAASGRPVLAVRAGDLPEWMPDWCVVDDYGDLLPLIELLRDDKDLYEETSKLFRTIALKELDYSIITKQFDKMFEGVLNG